MEVEVFRKGEQGAGLLQHFRGGAGRILAHAIGNQVFRGDGQELVAIGCKRFIALVRSTILA